MWAGYRGNVELTAATDIHNNFLKNRNKKKPKPTKLLKPLKVFKYVGMPVDHKYTTLKPLFADINAKCKASIAHLLSSNIPLKSISDNQLHKLFEAKILSIILYSSIIWGSQSVQEVERIQLLFYKRALKLPNFTSTVLTKCMFGLSDLHIVTILAVFRYLIKL
ncbi:Uncharacterised protein r2_g441 [Pycnogonum litorale]